MVVISDILQYVI